MTTKRKLAFLLGIMAILIIVGTIIVHLNKNGKGSTLKQEQEDEKFQIVTTFYPMYIIAKNVTDQIEEVEVTNLTDFNIGCAHDYQLTTDNMKLLSNADVIIVNGGGLEGFLEDLMDNFPNLEVIDSSKGIPMLAYEGQEEHDDVELHDDNGEGEDHDHGEYNPHIWLDPQIYIKQIENVRDGLMNYLDESIDTNAQNYIDKVQEIDHKLEDIIPAKKDEVNLQQSDDGVAIFHDSFAYLAKRLGLKVEYAIEVDSESALRAKDVSNIIDLISEGRIQYLFAENQYGELITGRIQAESDVEVFLMDAIVTGDGAITSYLNAMEDNIHLLKEVLGK